MTIGLPRRCGSTLWKTIDRVNRLIRLLVASYQKITLQQNDDNDDVSFSVVRIANSFLIVRIRITGFLLFWEARIADLFFVFEVQMANFLFSGVRTISLCFVFGALDQPIFAESIWDGLGIQLKAIRPYMDVLPYPVGRMAEVLIYDMRRS